MKNENFAIGIPTINRKDLLIPALYYYKLDFPETCLKIIDNGKQAIERDFNFNENTELIIPKKNLGVAGSWNLLCEKIFENHEFAVILNDDVYFGKDEWQVENLLKNFKADIYISELDWSIFILPKKTYLEIGKFDENFFPAYFEDNDYMFRLQEKNKQVMKIPFLNPIVFRSSKTIEKDTSLNNFQKNKEYFFQKWGKLPY